MGWGDVCGHVRGCGVGAVDVGEFDGFHAAIGLGRVVDTFLFVDLLEVVDGFLYFGHGVCGEVYVGDHIIGVLDGDGRFVVEV